MFKKIFKSMITMTLVTAMLFGSSFTAQAATLTTSAQDYRNQVIKVCGISDLSNLDQPMTRSEFAKMLVMSTTEKNMIGSTNVAAAADVPGTHPNAKYIRAALKNNWMRNRLGGKFEPDGAVTLMDAAKAALTMLGYTDEDFSGNVNDGRMAKFTTLGLNEGVTKTGSYDTLTVQEAINVIYNALKTNMKQGNSILGSAINLTLASDGEINPTEVLDNTMVGPILIKNYSELVHALPFSIKDGTYYFNGNQTSPYNNLQVLSYTSQLSNYGWLVIYYNEGSKTVWGYGTDSGGSAYHCIRGTVNAIYYDSDNIVSPTSVTIGGTNYTISGSDAKFMFSVNGTIKVGDDVVAICKLNNYNTEDEMQQSDYYLTGVVLYSRR